MTLRFQKSLRLYLTVPFAVAFWLYCYFSNGLLSNPVLSTAVALAFIFVSSLEITLKGSIVYSILIPLAAAVVTFITGQLAVGVKTSGMNLPTMLCNIVLISLLYYALLLAFGRIKPAVVISASAFFVLYFANYLLLLFRGRELALSDFYSFKNAMGVASSYEVVILPHLAVSIIAVAFMVFTVISAKMPDRDKNSRKKVRLTALGMTAICAVGLFIGVKYSKNSIQLLNANGAKFNGAAYNLIVEMREARVKAPEGYSASRANEILSRYTAEDNPEDTPHVIVIMNEALSDLSVLGDIETNVEPMPFFSSLSENTVRGYALASVLGGNTATSEWEFLTGNSAAFIPNGAVAYQQYVTNHIWSIVDTFKREDYTAVAMHPYTCTFWKRDSVYKLMGFDEMYFIDELSTSDKIRAFVSDRSLYSDVINRFEARADGEKLFMFNITMQNHGAYKWGRFEHTVTVNGGQWSEVDQYLTLTSYSDIAFRDLISYFETVEEKVIVVMFGDHQPSFSQDFYKSLWGDGEITFEQVQKKQTVPFVIWKNFESREEDGVLTGLNSLSGLVLEEAGISLPPYQAFLADMKNSIPAMNAYGYFSPTLDRFARTYEAEGDEAEWLKEYRILQYNNLFDGKKRSSAFDVVKK